MRSDESLAHRGLRSYTTFLVVLGWMHVVLFTLAGFVPWYIFAGQPIQAGSAWEQWAIYAAPAVGLLGGALFGLGYFVISGVIRVMLDQRDLLEELLQTHRHFLRIAESRHPGGRASPQDPFDLTGIKDTDEPVL
jgi:hypothetical protein